MDELALGKSRLIKYKLLDGQKHEGALLLPPDYQEGQRVPVIVDLYDDGAGTRLNYFGLGKEYGQILASRGYAMFFPGLPLQDSDPMRQLPGLVLPAVNQLIELGIADPDRLGLIGDSYGGYLTLALLTQTRMFRAAVAIAGMVNWTSMYGSLTNYGESFGVNFCEDGEEGGRMGASIWNQRERFIENGPANRVQSLPLVGSSSSKNISAEELGKHS